MVEQGSMRVSTPTGFIIIFWHGVPCGQVAGDRLRAAGCGRQIAGDILRATDCGRQVAAPTGFINTPFGVWHLCLIIDLYR